MADRDIAQATGFIAPLGYVEEQVVTQVLGIVCRAISGQLIRKAGLTRASGVIGAVTLIH